MGKSTKTKKKTKSIEAPDTSSSSSSSSDHLQQYALTDLLGHDRLSGKESDFVQQRIDAWNEGDKSRFHGHKGVGSAWTMDVGNIFGGSGRGDARLAFLDDGLKILNHKGKSLL